MGGVSGALLEHMRSGLTTVCRAWALSREDGVVMGFTDHDKALEFDGIRFRPDAGLSTSVLNQSTGLSVDNAEVMGALSDAAITEADIEAGRYDGAELRSWLVNWAEPQMRHLIFRGALGELKRGNGAFNAELRGLTEALGRPLGRVYQKPCTAVLGDAGCRFDTQTEGFFHDGVVQNVEDGRVFRFDGLVDFDQAWFAFGTLDGLSGACKGLRGLIKRDWFDGQTRVIELWHPMRAAIEVGDHVRLTAGCDKRMQSCRTKFLNIVNFQGFPDVPGDSFLSVQPVSAGDTGGGSRRR